MSAIAHRGVPSVSGRSRAGRRRFIIPAAPTIPAAERLIAARLKSQSRHRLEHLLRSVRDRATITIPAPARPRAHGQLLLWFADRRSQLRSRCRNSNVAARSCHHTFAMQYFTVDPPALAVQLWPDFLPTRFWPSGNCGVMTPSYLPKNFSCHLRERKWPNLTQGCSTR